MKWACWQGKDLKNLLLASGKPLQITEIPPFIVFSMNWYFQMSETSL